MLWLIAIIFSYFFFSLAALGDKVLLSGNSNPKSYTFLVGIFSILAILVIPFIDFHIPQGMIWLWIILDALFYVIGLYYFFEAVEKFDVSKIVPTVGALQPIFIFLISLLFWGNQGITEKELIAFIILLIGSVLISIEKSFKITKRSLNASVITAILFSLDIIFSKLVYMELPFWEGFVWIKIFCFLFALTLLLNESFRKDIFHLKKEPNKKQSISIFLSAQICGGLANVLQSLATALVPLVYLAIMNAMRGLQYVFLFIMVIVISYFFPKMLKEGQSKKNILQKIISIILIGVGLMILVL